MCEIPAESREREKVELMVEVRHFDVLDQLYVIHHQNWLSKHEESEELLILELIAHIELPKYYPREFPFRFQKRMKISKKTVLILAKRKKRAFF